MENNCISICMDVKLDIDKRPDSLKFKSWTKCQVKIEAIKCLPCFLRITIKREIDTEQNEYEEQKCLTVSINVPGVEINLAISRTKQYSYGLFWTHNRRNCFIYFALETELSCRRHMKWLKKSIKKLELHRQLFLEQRRNSRVPTRCIQPKNENLETNKKEDPKYSLFEKVNIVRSPLRNTTDAHYVNNDAWTQRDPRVSEIYEEIFEGFLMDDTTHLSRRLSRGSIASGIYEEMKPSGNNFNAIAEEPPPLPPLPPQRKRINTFETQITGQISEIPRSNTNPQSDLAKKKKYKTMLDNIFGGVRSKRSESVSEGQVCSTDEVINCVTPIQQQKQETAKTVNFTNSAIAAKRHKKSNKLVVKSNRNSFSSPDLSKINFLDTFDEQKVADFFNNSFSSNDDLDLSTTSLDESSILFGNAEPKPRLPMKFSSKESLNISAKIPNNFNFSACNSSTINLVGSNGAALWHSQQRNKIVVEDLAGYCIMQPIIKKTQITPTEPYMPSKKELPNTESTTAGYSTSSATSINTQPNQRTEVKVTTPAETKITEDSTIYENMAAADSNNSSKNDSTSKHTATDFSDNLYENLSVLKATQELEQLPAGGMSTSTPMDSPHAQTTPSTPKNGIAIIEEEESYYQTPRKSIISVDDKIPSYYPNSCDTMKMRRSPVKATTPTTSCSGKSSGQRNVISVKMRHERKENLYISSPQKIIDQRQNATRSELANKALKTKKTTAHKISENIYMVTHLNKRSSIKNNINNNNNNNTTDKYTNQGFSDEMKDKLQTELLQLAILQKIDFRFDDIKSPTNINVQVRNLSPVTTTPTTASNLMSTTPTSSKGNTTPRQLTPQHYLKQNQAANTSAVKTPESATKCAPIKFSPLVASDVDNGSAVGGVKKFASLPRFKKIDFSPLKLKINNVLQRNQQPDL